MGTVGSNHPIREMKLLSVLLLAGTAVLGFELESPLFNKWTQLKAMESCWGEENMKKYTVQVKRAISKCTQEDAPELDLPMYRSPYRVVNALLSSANTHENYLTNILETIVQNQNALQNMRNNGQYNSFQTQQRRPYPNQQQQNYRPMNQGQNYNNEYNNYNNYNDNNNNRFRTNMPNRQNQYDEQPMRFNTQRNQYTSEYETLMNDVAMNKLVNQVMGKIYETERRDNYQTGTNQYVPTRYSTNNYNNMENTYNRPSMEQRRFTREVNPNESPVPSVLALGDRLREKILINQRETEEKIRNFTCVMKELHVLNDNNELDLPAMKQNLLQFQMPSKWFKEHIVQDYENCYNMAQNVPKAVEHPYNYPNGPNMAKVKAFTECCKSAKARTCLYQDVKVKLEKNFGPLQKLLDTTQLNEAQLFPIILQLLYGDELEYFD